MCECGKGYVMPKSLSTLTVDVWGPKYWKLLHILATRLGNGDEFMDADAANGFFFVVSGLPDALPCNDCKSHAQNYLFENKFKPQGLVRINLRNYVQKWLLDFHNSVRIRKSQPLIINNIDEYFEIWHPQKFLPCDDEEMKLYFDYGKTYGILNYEKLTKWLNAVRRLRLLLGIS